MKVFTGLVALLVITAPLHAQGLQAGYAKVEITPTEPVYMGGYDLRDAPSDGIHGNDRLFVRALVFELGGTRIAFVMADIIGISDHDLWRSKISEATGIPAGNVLLGDVHDHSAPSPHDKRNARWVQQFEPALLAAVRDANSRIEPVCIAAGTGHSRIGMNRRQVRTVDSLSILTFDENARSQTFGKAKTDNPVQIRDFAGVVRLGANPDGPIDDKVQVVRIDSTAGKPVAVMIHYACHGTSLGGRNSKVSGEWMGRMQEYVEKQFPRAGSMFLPGAAGDINPRVVGGLDGYKDDINTTWALGKEIGAEVARVYRSLSPMPMANARIQLETSEILLPRRYSELFDNFADTAVKAPTTAVRIGDLMWITFPGEMFHAIGEKIRAAAPATYAHLIGYTNGYVGYFPEQKAYAEGGYEVATTHLDPAAEQIYMREIAELMKRFH